MDDVRAEIQEKRVKKCIEKWQHILWLGYWRIDIQWYREGIEARRGGDLTCVMEIDARYEYLEATLKVNLRDIEDLSDERLDYFVAHECAHMIVNEMRHFERGIEHEERVCTMLGKIFTFLEKLGEVKDDEFVEIHRAWQKEFAA